MTPTTAPRIRLEVIDIATPCPADFTAMTAVDGDRVRRCRHCDKDVYNLSAMTRSAAEQLLADRLGGDGHVCVRMYRRADATVVTADCRGRWRASAVRWAARWGGPVGAALSIALAALGCDATDRPPAADAGTPPPVAISGMVSPIDRPATTRPSTQPATRPADAAPPVMGRMVMPRPNG